MRGLSLLFLGVGVHSLDFVFELKAENVFPGILGLVT